MVISQVFKGDRHLTPEQAQSLAQYMGLSSLGQEYFLLLVHRARSGHHKLSRTYDRMLAEIKEKSQLLKNNIDFQEFDSEAKAEFYSRWYYSVCRLACDLENVNSVDELMKVVSVDRQVATKVMDFLFKHKLVLEDQDRKWHIGPQKTHLSSDSPQINSHRQNWRVKGLQEMLKCESLENLFYSGPMVLSEKSAETLRNKIVEFIKENSDFVVNSESETLYCLNIDWFKF